MHNPIVLVTCLCVHAVPSSGAEGQALIHDVDHALFMVGNGPKSSIGQVQVCHVAAAPLLVGWIGMGARAGVCDHDADGLVTDAAGIWKLGVRQAPGWSSYARNGIANTTLACETTAVARRFQLHQRKSPLCTCLATADKPRSKILVILCVTPKHNADLCTHGHSREFNLLTVGTPQSTCDTIFTTYMQVALISRDWSSGQQAIFVHFVGGTHTPDPRPNSVLAVLCWLCLRDNTTDTCWTDINP